MKRYGRPAWANRDRNTAVEDKLTAAGWRVREHESCRAERPRRGPCGCLCTRVEECTRAGGRTGKRAPNHHLYDGALAVVHPARSLLPPSPHTLQRSRWHVACRCCRRRRRWCSPTVCVCARIEYAAVVPTVQVKAPPPPLAQRPMHRQVSGNTDTSTHLASLARECETAG